MKSEPDQFRWVGLLCRVYAIALWAYPRAFRAQFGGEMQQVFRERCRAVARAHDLANLFRFLALSVKDWLTTSFRERFGHNAGIKASLSAVARHPATIWMLAIFICFFASTTMVRAYVISAGSMEGTLRVGDHVLADRLHSKARDIQRGDMITFLYPEDTGQTYVKRVIGLPGDRIRLSGKQVIRNGHRLEEPYAQHVASSTDPYRDNFPVEAPSYISARGREMLARHVKNGEAIVPSDSFFVLGDNRDISSDSRYWGFVPRENVIGKPLIVFWSYDAPTDELVGWNRTYLADLAQHFFTKTRWARTLLVLRSQPAQEIQP
jgi:signal peptidase I